MTNLLFIHGNRPCQFLDLAPYLAEHVADRTVILTDSESLHGLDLAGVEVVRCVPHRQPAECR